MKNKDKDWRPTKRLRLTARSGRYILQQLWKSQRAMQDGSPMLYEEWRDVPITEADHG